MTWIDYMRKILIAMMTVTIAFAPPLAADDGDLSQYAEQTEQLSLITYLDLNRNYFQY